MFFAPSFLRSWARAVTRIPVSNYRRFNCGVSSRAISAVASLSASVSATACGATTTASSPPGWRHAYGK